MVPWIRNQSRLYQVGLRMISMTGVPQVTEYRLKRAVDISDKPSPHSLRNRLLRLLWNWVYTLLFRPSPRVFHGWRRVLLRCFGAKVAGSAHVHARAKIWAPWNLSLGEHSTIAPDVDCYCAAPITIGDHTTVSQYSYLCTAEHDISHPRFVVTAQPIVIGSQAWIAADVFVAPGVTINDGAVVGARSSVFRDVAAWTVVVGSPARYLKERVIA